MQLPEVPHVYDMYAQDNEIMQQFRDKVTPWLDSREGNKLQRGLQPLVRVLLKEPEPDSVHTKYQEDFTLAHEFDDEQLALGPRHIGHLIGVALREQAFAISKGKNYITPVLPETFAVSPRLPGNVILLAKGTNDHLSSAPPALEAKLAWRVQAPPTPRSLSQATFTLVGRRIIPRTDPITLTREEFGYGTK